MKAQAGLAPITHLSLVKTSESTSQLEQNILEIYNQIERRAYELFERRGYIDGFHHEDWLSAESELFDPVPVTIHEQDNSFSLQAKVPGFNPDELEVKVEPGRVLIHGHATHNNQQQEGKVIYSESRSNNIFRIVDLPTAVNPDRAEASLKDGVLTLSLPKAETAKTKHVEIKAAAAA